MSIRMLAIELYRAKKEVERLEKMLDGRTQSPPERVELERQLRVARAEHQRLKAMLEGAKAD